MVERRVVRYSEAFKRQVVLELESGRFGSVGEAAGHHGVTGSTTVRKWVKRFGKNHLLAKVVRVENEGEKDQVRALRLEVARLERALGRTTAEKLLGEEFLRLACERMGEDVEGFKKKSDGKRSSGRENAAG